MSKAGRRLRVEVAFALPREQAVIPVEVEEGATVDEAIERSGILARFPEAAPLRARVGIFGKPVRPDRVLEDGDRVEIYRPLSEDPMEKRRKRAQRLRR